MLEQVGRVMVAVLSATTILCLGPIIVVQFADYWKRHKDGDGLGEYRAATAAIFLCAVIILSWRLAIWLDLTLANQAWLGPTMARWRIDLVIGTLCQLAASYPTYIWWRDRLRSRRRAKRVDC